MEEPGGKRGGGGGAVGFFAAGLLLLAAAGGYLAYRAAHRTGSTNDYHATTRPAVSTQPSTRDTEKPATKPKPPTTQFLDVVHAMYPTYAATQPLDSPVREISDAARVLLTDPVYLGPSYRADLWITRHDGLSTPAALKRAMDPAEYPQVHVVPERVAFVHWNPGEPRWTPFLVCPTSGGGFEVVSPKRREPIPVTRQFDWSRANSWNDKIVVPSESGVSVFRFEPRVTEDYHALLDADAAKAPHAKPQSLLDFQGLLAWVPAEDGHRGSNGAARYVDDKWTDLGPDRDWPAQIVHLVPLRDGSVLRIGSDASGAIKLTVASLVKADVDEQAVTKLIEQMSDPDGEKREAAFKELSQYGPGAFATLEKLAADQPPEARARLRALLRGQVTPTLGGMTLLGEKLQTVTRQDDGSVVFYADGGVSIPNESSEPTRRVPAWLSLRPGRAAEVLDDSLVAELKPGGCRILSIGNDWIVTGDAPGPRRWYGNGFAPLLRKDELAFSELVGVDRFGRWLFRKPGLSTETLVLDPSLPSPTPRLPVWEYTMAMDFGWDAQDWPAVKRADGDWSLRELGWAKLDETKNEKLLTDARVDRALAGEEADAAVGASQWSDIAARAKPLLIDPQGAEDSDGIETLRVASQSGPTIIWPLPASAVGRASPPPTLLRTGDAVLYLFNQPGRVLRIRKSPEGSIEPFVVEATFTKKVPSVDRPRRIWLDPAGRIVIADKTRLVIFFPQGYIPARIRDLMLTDGTE
jgi:hypothetical protein